MEFATGTYTGNGADDRWINGVGFEPDLVVVKGDSTVYAVFSTSAMDAGDTAYFNGPAANFQDAIQAFGADGFQVGTNANVNANGVEYYYAAFRDNGAGDFEVGSYTGDGNDDRSINIGMQPTILWIKRDGATRGVWRVEDNSGDDTLQFNNGANVTNCIQAFEANGFQIGTDSAVNTNGDTYQYCAWLDASGYIETGTYTGDGNDDRDINVGFEPDMVMVKGDTTQYAITRIDSMPAGDSGEVDNNALIADAIQDFEAGGNFEIGTHASVNTNGTDYYWAAWRKGESGTTTTTTSTTTTSTTTTTQTSTTTTTVTTTTTTTTTTTQTTTTTTTSSTTTTVTTSTTTTTQTTTTTTTQTSTTTTTTTVTTTTTTTTTSTTSTTTQSTTSTTTQTTTTLATAYPLTQTHEQSLSLTINVYKPDFSTGVYVPRGTYVGSIQGEINSYSHVIKASGGYWSSRFTIMDEQEKMESWLVGGLGRHVEVFDNALDKIWEGFVNQVDLTLGGLTVTRGPLLDTANSVTVVYSGTSTVTNPPVQGNRVFTAPANDADSQDKYGIITKILSAGGMMAENAEQVRDVYLAENKEPLTLQKIGGGGGLNVSLSCLGYAHWLNYPIAIVDEGTVSIHDQVANVLDLDPNGLFSSTNANISENTVQINAYDNKQRTAWTVIKALAALGDEGDNRYLFGVYSDRLARYEMAVMDRVEYRMYPGDPAWRVESTTGGHVWPWNVMPGRWMFLPSFLVGRAMPSDKRLDPRYVFIESVTYSAAMGLSVQGGRLDTISQKLAKLGLSGVGA
jgi:hypothetical protein